jgi:uncharacterized membrane protein
MSKSGTMLDVLMVGYDDPESAQRDFEHILKLVKDKEAKAQGMVLVVNDAQGQVHVKQTGDHLGREGVEWGAGIGLAIGLAAPVVLPALLVGAATGAVVSRFSKHRRETGIEQNMGEVLPPGSAGIVAIVPHDDLAALEAAVADAPRKAVAQTDETDAHLLQQMVVEGKFNPPSDEPA